MHSCKLEQIIEEWEKEEDEQGTDLRWKVKLETISIRALSTSSTIKASVATKDYIVFQLRKYLGGSINIWVCENDLHH